MPLKHEWASKFELKQGGTKLGPLTPWTEVQLDSDQTKSLWLTISQNVNFKDYHLAWKAVLDCNTQALTEAYGIAALKNSSGDYYLRSHCMSRLVGLGAFVSVNKNVHHAYELQYDFNHGKTGIL